MTDPSLRSRKTCFSSPVVIMRSTHSHPLCYLRGGRQPDERSGMYNPFMIANKSGVFTMVWVTPDRSRRRVFNPSLDDICLCLVVPWRACFSPPSSWAYYSKMWARTSLNYARLNRGIVNQSLNRFKDGDKSLPLMAQHKGLKSRPVALKLLYKHLGLIIHQG